MSSIHFIGEYSLAVTLLEEAHKRDKHNIELAEELYYAYFWTVNTIIIIIFHYVERI